MIEKCGKIPRKADKSVRTLIINSDEQYIVGFTKNLKKHGKTPPDTAVRAETDKVYKNYTWFQNPVN